MTGRFSLEQKSTLSVIAFTMIYDRNELIMLSTRTFEKSDFARFG